MTKRVLIPVDFSNHARAAAGLGVAIARRRQGAVSLYHAIGMLEHISVAPRVREAHLQDLVRQAEAQLEEWRRQLADAAGPEVEIELLAESAEPVRGILRRAREWNADLIVMGSLGAAAEDRVMFGSVAARVAREASCPVLVTRHDQRERIPQDGVFLRPMVAVDYSKFSRPGVELASALAAEGRTIELVHVFLAPDLEGAELARALGEARAEELERLERFAGSVDEIPLAVTLRSEGAHVADQILDFLERSKTDLLVLGAHGRDESVAVIGTVADRILRTSPAPVLVLPEASLD